MNRKSVSRKDGGSLLEALLQAQKAPPPPGDGGGAGRLQKKKRMGYDFFLALTRHFALNL
jgi:hypothetical protein